jgi:hypothetical protein
MSYITLKSDVTGRDGYIIVQALVYASEWLKSLADHRDEPSNRADMEAILKAIGSTNDKMFRWQARHKLANTTWASLEEVADDFNAAMQKEVV